MLVTRDNSVKFKRRGFTLIEIVIVLAIAALIMTGVFLAVAGAQRASRDNERKAYSRLLLTTILAYSGNNGGSTDALDTEGLLNGVGSNKKVLGQTVTNLDLAPPGFSAERVSVKLDNHPASTSYMNTGDECTSLGPNFAYFLATVSAIGRTPFVGVCLESSNTYYVVE